MTYPVPERKKTTSNIRTKRELVKTESTWLFGFKGRKPAWLSLQLCQQPGELTLLGLGQARRQPLLEGTHLVPRCGKIRPGRRFEKQGMTAPVAGQHFPPDQAALFEPNDHRTHG